MALNWYFNPRPERLWVRFYFYFDTVFDNAYKFCIYWVEPSHQVGGLLFSPLGTQRLGWSFYDEWSSQFHGFRELSSLTGGWHSIEMDYFRVGDTSGDVVTTGDGEPSVAFWLDNEQITSGFGNPPRTGYWKNGRLYAGARSAAAASNARFRTLQLMANSNRGGSMETNLWVDRVSLSSVGRIGP